MLYGKKKVQNMFLSDAKKYAKENDLQLVFGSLCGSISKGFQYYDSDYDTRFLFVNKDFPEKVNYTPTCKESEMVYRYYPKDVLPYEWIPFWELTSFFQYLVIPGLDNKFSLGLYNIVSWTLQSPYVWDPYGIQGKIIPIINTFFIKEYKIGYHVREIQQKMEALNSDYIIAKNYLHMIYSALIIEYCINYNIQPPTHISGLAGTSKYQDLYIKINDIVYKSRREADCFLEKNTEDVMHKAHFSVMIETDKYINNYILAMLTKGEKIMKDYDFLSHERKSDMRGKVALIYEIVYESMRRIPIKDIS